MGKRASEPREGAGPYRVLPALELTTLLGLFQGLNQFEVSSERPLNQLSTCVILCG